MNEFKCNICSQNHSIPTEGFPINRSIVNQINNATASNITEFESLYELVIAKLKQTELNLTNGDYAIKEFCSELKRLVQLAKELKITKKNDISDQLMEQMDDLSDEMMKKIESFEQEKLKAFFETQNTTFKTKQDEMKQLLSEYNQKLENSKLINNQHLVLSLQAQLETLNENFLSLLFNGEYLQFNTKETENSFGEIVLKKLNEIDLTRNKNEIEVSHYVLEMKNPEATHLYSRFEDAMSKFAGLGSNFDEEEDAYIETRYVHFNDNKYAVFLYYCSFMENDEITCLLFDDNNTFIKKKNIKINYAKINSIQTNGEDVIISFRTIRSLDEYTESEHDDEDDSENDEIGYSGRHELDFLNGYPKIDYNIVVFNKELEQTSRITGSTSYYKPIELTNSLIFTSCEQLVLVFNWSLESPTELGVRTIMGQNRHNPEEAFYFPNPIISIKQKNGFFYILERPEKYKTCIRIIDQKNGKFLDTFIVESKTDCIIESLLHIDSNNRLIFAQLNVVRDQFNQLSKKSFQSLVFLSQKGDFLKEIKLISDKLIDWSSWSIDKEGILRGHFYKTQKSQDDESDESDKEDDESNHECETKKILIKYFKLPFQ